MGLEYYFVLHNQDVGIQFCGPTVSTYQRNGKPVTRYDNAGHSRVYHSYTDSVKSLY